jgi:hypothetical protein
MSFPRKRAGIFIMDNRLSHSGSRLTMCFYLLTCPSLLHEMVLTRSLLQLLDPGSFHVFHLICC